MEPLDSEKDYSLGDVSSGLGEGSECKAAQPSGKRPACAENLCCAAGTVGE
jgi:hypothetical protein